jgi:hypothetical protein
MIVMYGFKPQGSIQQTLCIMPLLPMRPLRIYKQAKHYWKQQQRLFFFKVQTSSLFRFVPYVF